MVTVQKEFSLWTIIIFKKIVTKLSWNCTKTHILDQIIYYLWNWSVQPGKLCRCQGQNIRDRWQGSCCCRQSLLRDAADLHLKYRQNGLVSHWLLISRNFCCYKNYSFIKHLTVLLQDDYRMAKELAHFMVNKNSLIKTDHKKRNTLLNNFTKLFYQHLSQIFMSISYKKFQKDS